MPDARDPVDALLDCNDAFDELAAPTPHDAAMIDRVVDHAADTPVAPAGAAASSGAANWIGWILGIAVLGSIVAIAAWPQPQRAEAEASHDPSMAADEAEPAARPDPGRHAEPDEELPAAQPDAEADSPSQDGAHEPAPGHDAAQAPDPREGGAAKRTAGEKLSAAELLERAKRGAPRQGVQEGDRALPAALSGVSAIA